MAMVGFGLAVLPICLTPGVSFTLVTQRVLATGRLSGVRVAAGTSCGLICHAMLAGLGLSAIIMSSSAAFTAVKLLGAAYLIGMGLATLWGARARTAAGPSVGRRLPWADHGDFAQALLGNVLNPKAAAVYLTLAPQFLHRGQPVLPQMLQLVAAHVAVAGGWLLVWTQIVGGARRVVRSEPFRRVMDRVTGSVLVGLGVRTAVAR
jgi:threonine/homoserine/homoserine lactone efflux protein